MERYIGIDVHQASCTVAVVGTSGKRLKSLVVETQGATLVDAVKSVAGQRHVCVEEGTQSAWVYEVLSPHVAQMVVTHLGESRGPKDDKRDAFALAERLRVGRVQPVFKDGGKFGKLRELARNYSRINTDVVRCQSRLKALYRSRGVSTAGLGVYSESEREGWLKKLPEAYRDAAQLMYAQYDALHALRKVANKALVNESHRHPIAAILETCPGLGPLRVAQLIPIVVSPYRFRTKRQFWSYCGLGVVMRSSSDWMQTPNG